MCPSRGGKFVVISVTFCVMRKTGLYKTLLSTMIDEICRLLHEYQLRYITRAQASELIFFHAWPFVKSFITPRRTPTFGGYVLPFQGVDTEMLFRVNAVRWESFFCCGVSFFATWFSPPAGLFSRLQFESPERTKEFVADCMQLTNRYVDRTHCLFPQCSVTSTMFQLTHTHRCAAEMSKQLKCRSTHAMPSTLSTRVSP